MTESKRGVIAELVTEARHQNRRLVNARRSGFEFPLARYLRTKAMGEARAIKGIPARHRGAGLQKTLCEIADLVCEIDHHKNHLPAIYQGDFTQVVEVTHGHVKTIADDHSLVVYADNEEGRNEKQTH